MNDVKLPPVKVVESSQLDLYRFKLTDGCHRLHCAIAFGHTQIPAKWGSNANILEGIQFYE